LRAALNAVKDSASVELAVMAGTLHSVADVQEKCGQLDREARKKEADDKRAEELRVQLERDAAAAKAAEKLALAEAKLKAERVKREAADAKAANDRRERLAAEAKSKADAAARKAAEEATRKANEKAKKEKERARLQKAKIDQIYAEGKKAADALGEIQRKQHEEKMAAYAAHSARAAAVGITQRSVYPMPALTDTGGMLAKPVEERLQWCDVHGFDPYVVFGVPPGLHSSTYKALKQVFSSLSHSDKGGRHEWQVHINRAYDFFTS
jgi:murein DD-endopeptidase MepM/ murein hydrolase activator NlpD